jgi:uncharacterized lipoprotein YddW (UPF0748 family)
MGRRILHHARVAAAVILAAGVLASTPSAGARADSEVRGLWVLRSTLASPRSIQQMVSTARGAGFNTLLVQVRGRGDAYYDSRIEPRATELDDQLDSFDPLALTISLAHEAGLKVHAWINIDLVASATLLPRSRAHVLARHPEWLMVPKALAPTLKSLDPASPGYVGQLARWTRGASEQVEGLYLSPVLPAAQDYTASVVADVARRYQIDGVHFDYLRYPSDQFDYSALSLAAFRASTLATTTPAEQARLDQLAATSVTAWPDAQPAAWSAFRRGRMTSLVVKLREAALSARPGISVSAAVVPNADDARDSRMQDWREWARTGLLDVLCPMIYTTDAAEFSTLVTRVKSDANAAAVWAGIGAYRLTPARTNENVRAARKAGVAGLLVYSYDSLSSSEAPANYFSLIRPTLVDAGQSSVSRR